MNYAFADVKASLKQNTVYDGDPVTLLIETSQNTNAKPNLSVLSEYFQVLGTSTSSQINVLNGQRSYKKTWTVNLQAKKKGEITIPSILIGNEKTKPLNVTIIDLPPEVKEETGKHVFVESSVDSLSDKTYVQQQIPYTVKLFYDSTMQSAEMLPPEINNAVMEQLGDDRRFQIQRAGKLFTVVEKHYVISPEKSGTLHIPPTVIKGRMSLPTDKKQIQKRGSNNRDFMNRFFQDFRQDPFFNNSPFPDDLFSQRSRGASKPFSIQSKALEVDVLPVPKEFSAAVWLPAEQLIVKDSWTKSPPELKVGEPVTRTITLQAKGLAGSQIPTIDIKKPDGIKIYPETPSSETRTDGNTVFGIQRLKLSYIPNKSGSTTIPEIKVDWWDVKSKKQKTATLPAWNLSVAKGDFVEEEPSLSNKNQTQSEGDDNPASNDLSSKPKNSDENIKTVNWNLFGGILLALLFAAIGFRTVQKYLKNSPAPTNKHEQELFRSKLLKACSDNDPKSAEKYLIKYVQLAWNDSSIQSLQRISNSLQSDSNVILQLEQNLYGTAKNNWQGMKLHQLIETGLLKKPLSRKSLNDSGLSPLYPT
jgi:hypothetical protein